MPITPEQIKSTKKSIKNWIKAIEKRTEVTLSYEDIKKDIAQIYTIEDEAKRAQLISEYELIIRHQLCDHLFDRRTVIFSSRGLQSKNDKKPIKRTPPSYAVDAARRVVGLFCSLHEEDYYKNNIMTREKADEELKWTLDEISKRNSYDEMPKFFKEWDTSCVREEIENFKETYQTTVFHKNPNYKYEGKFGKNGTGHDAIAASAYYLTTLMKAELERADHGRWWRFKNFRKVAAYRDYIKTAEDMFKRIEFDPAVHGEAALEELKKSVMNPHDLDIDTAKNEHRIAYNWVKQQETPELNIARAQLKRAKELDRKPATSFYTKMKDMMDKYNILKEQYQEVFELFQLNNAAEKYDTERDLDAVKESAGMTYMRLFMSMFSHAVVYEKGFDIKEIMNDVGTLCEAVLENYLDFSKMKELQNLDKPIYAYDETLESKIINFLGRAKNGVSVDLSIGKAIAEFKEATPSDEYIENAKKGAAEVVNGWEKKPQNEIKQEEKQEEIIEQKEEKKDEIIANNDQIAANNGQKKDRQPLTNEARALATEMLKISFRPSKQDLQGQLENAKLITQFFDNNEMISKESHAVFKANKSKLMHYKQAVENGKENEMEAQFETSEKVLQAQYGNAKLQAIEDIEKERMNVNLEADLGGKNAPNGKEQNQIQAKVEADEKENVNNSLIN